MKQYFLLHQEVLHKYGGAAGIRDEGLLDSALNRPFHFFGNEELYPGPYLKAASILESIVCNHPFIDENRQIGYLLSAIILLESAI